MKDHPAITLKKIKSQSKMLEWKWNHWGNMIYNKSPRGFKPLSIFEMSMGFNRRFFFQG